MRQLWSKRHSLRLGENWSYAPLNFKQLFGVNFPNQFIGYKDGIGFGYVDQIMLDECHAFMINKIEQDGFSDFFEAKADIVFADFLDYCKSLPDQISEKITNEDLNSILIEFTKKEDYWMNYVWAVFLLDECLTKVIQQVLIRRKDLTQYLPIIVAQKNKTAAGKMKLDLLNLASMKLSGKAIDKQLHQLVKKYSYFSILNMDESPLEKSYFITEVDSLVTSNPREKILSINNADEHVEAQWKEVENILKDEKILLNILRSSRSVAFYREHRNDLRQECYFYARHIYLEISRRSGIEISILVFATRQEISDYLLFDKKIDPDDLQNRWANSCIVSNYESGEIVYEFDKQKVDRIWPSEKIFLKKIIQGVPVYGSGKLIGKVKIISDVNKDSDNFKVGDILVATTTNLTFVPLFSRALAVVTDQGGLLTHAAIVARELKKPCVVGTYSATKALKDGDMVEVDADNGIVRIIE